MINARTAETYKMHQRHYEYSAAINAKGEPFPSEPLIMALLLLSEDKK
jgi:hypothetical protein